MKAARGFLTSLFDAAIAAAHPDQILAKHMPPRPKGRTVVIGAGKGAAQLAQAFERIWDGPLSGVVVTRYGYGAPCRQIQVLEAAHPVPDRAGLAASAALFQAVQGLGPQDLVVALICGGGSALLPCPPAGLDLRHEQAVNEALLASGMPIAGMNAIRKHVSGIKGGWLAAAAAPARLHSLIVSDVPGDDPAQVASGPTVPDHVSRAQALDLVARYGLCLPPEVMAHLARPEADAPMPGDPVFAGQSHQVIASAGISLRAAQAAALAQGVGAVILSDAVEGEAREVAHVHSAIAAQVLQQDHPFAKPVVIISGGETTVTLRGPGRGGRNSEFLLSLAQDLDAVPGWASLAADTDGIDGSEANAGAFADSTSCARMRLAGRDPAQDLAQNDAYSAFEAAGDLFAPGPTGTNVNDFRAIYLPGHEVRL
ncbi:MAG: glycerate kinase [Mangrovicoccus sp.]|nr:glycerate kinase [Mangrovicoccus sp.]